LIAVVAGGSIIAVRVLLAIIGGYTASAGLTALIAIALPVATPLPRSESVLLASMLGFIVYLVLLLWSFAERRLWRLGFVLAFLAGGGFGFAYLMGAGG
jgi:hypothetical protein